MSGVRIAFHVQRPSWRLEGPTGTARNGELVSIRNKFEIKPTKVPKNARYLGIFIYPDYTAEIVYAPFSPDMTERA